MLTLQEKELFMSEKLRIINIELTDLMQVKDTGYLHELNNASNYMVELRQAIETKLGRKK